MVSRYFGIVFLAMGLQASGQTVFIPDPFVRTWLNIAKPNSVDANGLCDTAAWNAVPPPAVGFDLTSVPIGGTVDLEGIQHLKIGNLSIRDGNLNNAMVALPGFPIGLGQIRVIDIPMANITGLLPLPAISTFWCDNCGMPTLPAFSGSNLWVWNNDLSAPGQVVPSSVTDLRMNDCNISNVPTLPAGLFRLEISNNPLAAWPSFPTGLQALEATQVGLNYVPINLPTGLNSLTVDGNGISTLPGLPPSLVVLSANNNLLSSLPPLPADLEVLYVSHNPLGSIPALPPDLMYLTAGSCGLSTLPALPPYIANVHLDSNTFSTFPALPEGIGLLNLRGCANLACLPPLPVNLVNLWLGGSGVTCLPNIPTGLNQNPISLGIAPVVCNPGTSPCPIVDPLITGTTFADADGDGVFDAGEAVRPNWMVEAQPGDLMAGSDANGNYVLPAGIGSYTVSAVPMLYWPPTNQAVVTLSALGQVDSLNHLGAVEIGGMYDLVTEVTGTNVRPGFNTQVWVTVRNVGTEPTTADVQLTFDPALSFVSSSIAGTVNGNVVDWATAVLVPGEEWMVAVQLYGPPTLVLGDPVVQQATATPGQPDQTSADNTDVLNDVVVGSYDPNDKQVEPAFLSLADVAAATRLHYTVRFQNTGTFMAERVLITDTLSTDLYWTTINVEGASHAHTWYLQNGVLHVLFENINLPDSTSDEPGSHGFVKFSFVASTTLTTGDVVDNIANIHFDFNEPIITNTASVFVNTAMGVEATHSEGLVLWPVPATDVLWVRCDAPVQRVQLIDRTGRVVRDVAANGQRAPLDVRDLSAGAYAVRCTTEEGVVQRLFVR